MYCRASSIRLVCGRLHIGEQLLVYIQDKTGGIPGRAVQIAPAGFGEEQALFGTGHGHEGKTAFLLHSRKRPYLAGRKDPFVHPAEENVGEFQALGGVDGHQLYLILPGGGVAVGKEGHMGQIMFQGAFLAAGGLVLIDRLLQLRQVVQTFLTAFGAEHFLIAAVIEKGG